MSTKTISKIETRIVVGFDDETKAEIEALKGKLDEVARGLSAKKESHADGLLAAMQAEAANDAPQDEIKQLGQWVFEGCDPKWVSAVIQPDGQASRCNFPTKNLMPGEWGGWIPNHFLRLEFDPINGCFDADNWKDSAIDRETVNDIDYLSTSLDESVPHIDDVLAQPNWLSESVPKITDADMQLIFIKNLSDVLIQRMHSMDRFSEDDYAVGWVKPWDIVIGQRFAGVGEPSELDHQREFAIVTGKRKDLHSPQQDHFEVIVLSKARVCEESTKVGGWASIYHETNDTYRTITEAELPAFRAALEACYA